MLIMQEGNLVGVFRVNGKSDFTAEHGEKKVAMLRVPACCKKNTTNGLEEIQVALLFFAKTALTFTSLSLGDVVVVLGRYRSNSYYRKSTGRYEPSMTVVVDDCRRVDDDPDGVIPFLEKERREDGE